MIHNIVRHTKNQAPVIIGQVETYCVVFTRLCDTIVKTVFNDAWELYQSHPTSLDKVWYTVDEDDIRFDCKNGWTSSDDSLTKGLIMADNKLCGC